MNRWWPVVMAAACGLLGWWSRVPAEEGATQVTEGAEPRAVIVNPVALHAADPWVLRWADDYLYLSTTGWNVTIHRATRLWDVARGDNAAMVWDPPDGQPYSHNVWAPELHRLDGRWYVYVAADDGRNEHHRMWVLAAETDDPQGPYRLVGKIADPADRWAIDGTVFDWRGKRYFVWSGWPGEQNVQQNLYIAAMASPTALQGERVLLSEPTHPWERHGLPINEGPQALIYGDDARLHLIYSASGFWTPNYCLGRLTLLGDDPLDPTAWVKHPEPVFAPTDAVKGVGHGSFTQTPDGRWWQLYHAHAQQQPDRGVRRDLRMQPFDFTAGGTPRFGAPIPPGQTILLD